jgi:hypothetical protein
MMSAWGREGEKIDCGYRSLRFRWLVLYGYVSTTLFNCQYGVVYTNEAVGLLRLLVENNLAGEMVRTSLNR